MPIFIIPTMVVRVAVIDRDVCIRERCGYVCAKVCPPNRMGEECIVVEEERKFPAIAEPICIGCGLCVKKCPVQCISVVNLAQELEEPPPGELKDLKGASDHFRKTSQGLEEIPQQVLVENTLKYFVVDPLLDKYVEFTSEVLAIQGCTSEEEIGNETVKILKKFILIIDNNAYRKNRLHSHRC